MCERKAKMNPAARIVPMMTIIHMIFDPRWARS
jgi:hypothetical protein